MSTGVPLAPGYYRAALVIDDVEQALSDHQGGKEDGPGLAASLVTDVENRLNDHQGREEEEGLEHG